MINRTAIFALPIIFAAGAALAGCNDNDQPADVPATVVSVSPSTSVEPSASVEVVPSESTSVSVSASPAE